LFECWLEYLKSSNYLKTILGISLNRAVMIRVWKISVSPIRKFWISEFFLDSEKPFLFMLVRPLKLTSYFKL